jgi:hypothetical protein
MKHASRRIGGKFWDDLNLGTALANIRVIGNNIGMLEFTKFGQHRRGIIVSLLSQSYEAYFYL